MSLNELNKDAISFKRVSGKAHTQQTFEFNEEKINSSASISFSTVFGQKIDSQPVTNGGLSTLFSNDAIVEKIKFELDIVPDTEIGINQSQAYVLKLPTGYTSNGFLKNTYTGGTYLHDTLGRLQIVPTIKGLVDGNGDTEYDPVLYQTNGSTIIPKFSTINWRLDPFSGVLFVQDPPAGFDVDAARPGFLEAYLYVGKYLDQPKKIYVTGDTILGDEEIVIVDSSIGTHTVSLIQTPSDSKTYFIQDTGNGLTNNILVSGGTKSINGQSTFSISKNYGGVRVIFDEISDQWFQEEVSTTTGSGSTSNNSNVTIITGATTLSVDNDMVLCNPSGGSFTAALPSSPSDGLNITLKDIGFAFSNNITISGNGKNIDGSSTILVDTNFGGYRLVYSSVLDSWFIRSFTT